MDAAIVLEPRKDAVAVDLGRSLAHTARTLEARHVDHGKGPALERGVRAVHLKHLRGEEAGLLAASARTHLENHVAVVDVVVRHEARTQVGVELGELRLDAQNVLLSQRTQLRVAARPRRLGHE